MAKLFPALVLCCALALSACAHGNKKRGAKYSMPTSAFQTKEPNQVTIAVVGINDFHGSLLPRERKISTKDGELVVKSGGAPALYSMVSVLKDEMGGRVLIIDAGDDWQGTLESNLAKGATVTEFFNRLGVRAAAIGNHEFDFNIENMQKRFGEAKYAVVASNIYEKKTKKRPNWKNVKPSVLLDVDGVKIGIIGFSTINTPGTTRYEFVNHLEFRNPVAGVEEESAKLRAQGAQAVLVTAHAGTFCERKYGLNSWRLYASDDWQGSCDDDEISNFAAALKPGTLDGIVAGHTHQVIHHWLFGIPTIEDEAYNQHFNVIYYTFDRFTGKLMPDQTRIEGLIPICEQMFEGLDHCDVRRLKAGENPKLVPATFHGQTVVPDPTIAEWLKPILASTEKYRKEVIATSGLPLTHFRDRESSLGNLVADALRDKAKSDFSLVNSGGIRTSLDAGPVTYDGIFRAFPFDNLLNVLRLNGKELKLLFQIATAGSHGIVGFSGLKIKLIPYDRDVPREDMDHDGRLENWEGDRIVEITRSDGRELKDDQYYTVATFDFLVNGGDDLHWFMSHIPEERIIRNKSAYCRDIVTEYLRRAKVINTPERPLIDSKNPRVTFQE